MSNTPKENPKEEEHANITSEEEILWFTPKIEGEILDVFHQIHQKFSVESQVSLALQLKSAVSFDYISFTPKKYHVIRSTFKPYTNRILLCYGNFPGMILICIPIVLLYSMLDLLLDGNGDILSDTTKNPRKLTKIEESLLTPVVRIISQALKLSWDPPFPLQLEEEKIVYRLEDAEAAPAHGTYMMATFLLTMGNQKENMTIFYPLPWIFFCKQHLRERKKRQENYYGTTAEEKECTFKDIEHTPISLSVIFGEKMFPAQDIFTLAPGDIIMLEDKLNHPVGTLYVEDVAMFKGKIGQVRNRFALEIEDYFP